MILSLACVHKEYPNKIALMLNGNTDVRAPRELTPSESPGAGSLRTPPTNASAKGPVGPAPWPRMEPKRHRGLSRPKR